MADMMWNEWSLWLSGLLLFVLLCIALELGFRLSMKRRGPQGSGGSDFLVSATLGLLALLLGFTFSLALQRHEERRSLVIAEANAIGTSWLRIQAIDPDERDDVEAAFQRYVKLRLDWSLASDDGDQSKAIFARTAATQADLWAITTAALANGERVIDARLMLDPLNESFDIAAEREVRRQAHLPGAMLLMLMVFMVFATMLVGWRLGEMGRRMTLPAGLTMLLLTLAVVVTLDLDMSRSGMITVSQDAMKQAVAGLTTQQI